ENFAHGVDAEYAVLIRHQRRDLGRLIRIVFLFLGVQEMLLLQYRMQLAKGFENGGFARKIEIPIFCQQALENQLMCRASAEADISAFMLHDLVVAAVELRR